MNTAKHKGMQTNGTGGCTGASASLNTAWHKGMHWLVCITNYSADSQGNTTTICF